MVDLVAQTRVLAPIEDAVGAVEFVSQLGVHGNHPSRTRSNAEELAAHPVDNRGNDTRPLPEAFREGSSVDGAGRSRQSRTTRPEPSASTSNVTVWPSWSSPASMRRARASSMVVWMSRLSGRAP